MRPIGDVINKVVKRRKLGNFADVKDEILRNKAIALFLKEHRGQISQQMIDNSLPNLYEFYEQQENKNQVLAGYAPELFLNGHVIDVRYHPTKAKIAADQRKENERHLQLIDLPASLHQVQLSQVDIAAGRSEALRLLQQFLKAYAGGQHPHQKGIYLTGDFGVGKTYILAGLANQVASMGKQVIFLHVPTFVAGLTSHFEDNSLQKEIQRLANCDLLILDDIGAESLSQWSRDDVLGVILQARMDNVLPTFFSSNFDMEKLEAHFAETKNAIDPVKAARLMQRIRFLAQEVVVSGPNRRKI